MLVKEMISIEQLREVAGMYSQLDKRSDGYDIYVWFGCHFNAGDMSLENLRDTLIKSEEEDNLFLRLMTIPTRTSPPLSSKTAYTVHHTSSLVIIVLHAHIPSVVSHVLIASCVNKCSPLAIVSLSVCDSYVLLLSPIRPSER